MPGTKRKGSWGTSKYKRINYRKTKTGHSICPFCADVINNKLHPRRHVAICEKNPDRVFEDDVSDTTPPMNLSTNKKGRKSKKKNDAKEDDVEAPTAAHLDSILTTTSTTTATPTSATSTSGRRETGTTTTTDSVTISLDVGALTANPAGSAQTKTSPSLPKAPSSPTASLPSASDGMESDSSMEDGWEMDELFGPVRKERTRRFSFSSSSSSKHFSHSNSNPSGGIPATASSTTTPTSGGLKCGTLSLEEWKIGDEISNPKRKKRMRKDKERTEQSVDGDEPSIHTPISDFEHKDTLSPLPKSTVTSPLDRHDPTCSPSHQAEWDIFVPLWENRKKGEILEPLYKQTHAGFPHHLLQPQTFVATWPQFSNVPRFLDFMEFCGFHIAGIAKVIPPPGWTPRSRGYNDVQPITSAPKVQNMEISASTRNGDVTLLINQELEAMTVEQFREYLQVHNPTPPHSSLQDLEEIFWETYALKSSVYLSYQATSLFDPDMSVFNLRQLNTDLTKYGNWEKGPGLITPYLYTGSWGSRFGWHTEDKYFSGVNYLHFGAVKTWYAIPPSQGRQFEAIMSPILAELYPGSCPDLLTHKSIITRPSFLRDKGLLVNKVNQYEKEMVVLSAFTYHQGFNNGENTAEAVNWLNQRGLLYLKRAVECTIDNCPFGEVAQIDLEPFVQGMEGPGKLDLWRKGQDLGRFPEDPETVPETYCGKDIRNKGHIETPSIQKNKSRKQKKNDIKRRIRSLDVMEQGETMECVYYKID